jgi:hypothetical protein
MRKPPGPGRRRIGRGLRSHGGAAGGRGGLRGRGVQGESRPVTGARAGKLWWGLLRLAEQVGQLGLDVHEVGLFARGDDRVGPLEEVGDLLDRRFEVRLTER